jgi:hypothetical protein
MILIGPGNPHSVSLGTNGTDMYIAPNGDVWWFVNRSWSKMYNIMGPSGSNGLEGPEGLVINRNIGGLERILYRDIIIGPSANQIDMLTFTLPITGTAMITLSCHAIVASGPNLLSMNILLEAVPGGSIMEVNSRSTGVNITYSIGDVGLSVDDSTFHTFILSTNTLRLVRTCNFLPSGGRITISLYL